MKIVGNNLEMTRGDSETITVYCTNENDEFIPFSIGDKIIFTVEDNQGSKTPILQKIITEFVDGKAVIQINPSDTKLLRYRTYHYDIQWTMADTSVKTIISYSDFTISREVTYE